MTRELLEKRFANLGKKPAKKPALKKPAAKKPTKKPATKKPAAKKPARPAKKPAVKKSTRPAKKPALKKPALKKPAAKKPAAKKPTKKPAVKKSTRPAKKPAAKKPALKKPALKKPAAKKPALKKPAAKKPTKKPAPKKPTKKPAAKKPATKKPALKKPATKGHGKRPAKKPTSKKSAERAAYEKLLKKMEAVEEARRVAFETAMKTLLEEQKRQREAFEAQLAELNLEKEKWKLQQEAQKFPPPLGPSEQEEARKREFPRLKERFGELLEIAEQKGQLEHIETGTRPLNQSTREGFQWAIDVWLDASDVEEILYLIDQTVRSEQLPLGYRSAANWSIVFQVSAVGTKLIGSKGAILQADDPDAHFFQTEGWESTGVWSSYEGVMEHARSLLEGWAEEDTTHVFVRSAIVDNFSVLEDLS